jgi:hypothetical protein
MNLILVIPTKHRDWRALAKHTNEPSGSKEDSEFLDQLLDWRRPLLHEISLYAY